MQKKESLKSMSFFFLYLVLFVSLFFTHGCSGKINNNKKTEITYTTPSNDIIAPVTPKFVRKCYDHKLITPDREAHKRALESLYTPKTMTERISIGRDEPPTTFCINDLTSGIKNFQASIRIEFEHDDEGAYINFTKEKLIYSSRENNIFHLIFRDGYGYVEVKAHKTQDSYNTTIRFANFKEELKSVEAQKSKWYKDITQQCLANPASCQNIVLVQSNEVSTDYDSLEVALEHLNGQHNTDHHFLGTVEIPALLVE